MIDLAAIKARCEAATEGPWTSDQVYVCSENDEGAADLGRPLAKCLLRYPLVCTRTAYVNTHYIYANAEFIAHARTDVPELVAEVERLAHKNEVLKQITLTLLKGWRLVLTGGSAEESKNLLDDVLDVLQMYDTASGG